MNVRVPGCDGRDDRADSGGQNVLVRARLVPFDGNRRETGGPGRMAKKPGDPPNAASAHAIGVRRRNLPFGTPHSFLVEAED